MIYHQDHIDFLNTILLSFCFIVMLLVFGLMSLNLIQEKGEQNEKDQKHLPWWQPTFWDLWIFQNLVRVLFYTETNIRSKIPFVFLIASSFFIKMLHSTIILFLSILKPFIKKNITLLIKPFRYLCSAGLRSGNSRHPVIGIIFPSLIWAIYPLPGACFLGLKE